MAVNAFKIVTVTDLVKIEMGRRKLLDFKTLVSEGHIRQESLRVTSKIVA